MFVAPALTVMPLAEAAVVGFETRHFEALHRHVVHTADEHQLVRTRGPGHPFTADHGGLVPIGLEYDRGVGRARMGEADRFAVDPAPHVNHISGPGHGKRRIDRSERIGKRSAAFAIDRHIILLRSGGVRIRVGIRIRGRVYLLFPSLHRIIAAAGISSCHPKRQEDKYQKYLLHLLHFFLFSPGSTRI